MVRGFLGFVELKCDQQGVQQQPETECAEGVDGVDGDMACHCAGVHV